jgi:hypothetical protein
MAVALEGWAGALAGKYGFEKFTGAGKTCLYRDYASTKIGLIITFEPVVQGFQADPQGGGGGVFVTVEML